MGDRVAGIRTLIYGGGSGLGFACADCLATEGAKVFITSRDADRLATAAARLPDCGWAQGDATNEADVGRVTAAAIDRLGGLDSIIVSSGVSSIGSVCDASLESVKGVLLTNLLPTFLASQAAYKHLAVSGRGSIITIASVVAVVGMAERVAYCTSKAGLLGMVRAMALDLAPKGIRVNAISPSLVLTDLAKFMIGQEADPQAVLARRLAQHPLQRLGEPNDVGYAAVYLASSEAKWITGQNFVVDGGLSIQ